MSISLQNVQHENYEDWFPNVHIIAFCGKEKLSMRALGPRLKKCVGGKSIVWSPRVKEKLAPTSHVTWFTPRPEARKQYLRNRRYRRRVRHSPSRVVQEHKLCPLRYTRTIPSMLAMLFPNYVSGGNSLFIMTP